MPPLIFRKGLELKHEVADALASDYRSDLVQRIKDDGFRYMSGRLTIHLAREFGFCYGVDRAVDYAYQARRRFPNRPLRLTGEIIHNPHVNDQLRAQGVRFLTDPGESIAGLTPEHVVLLPAFGVPVDLLLRLQDQGCTLVDTTCGSVLNVWKNVRRYAREGFTSVIHGKYWHEETQATASQVLDAGGKYLIVLDREQAALACDFVQGRGTRRLFLDAFAHATSPGFDPDHDLERIGCANQTTMLSSESLDIGDMFRQAIQARHGEAAETRFLAFDTICSATQDRQDAVLALLGEAPLDLLIVLGGYNSSNTCNLARIAAGRVATYHIAEPDSLLSPAEVRHKPVGAQQEIVTTDWLPSGPTPATIGLTSGASTPDNLIERTIRRLEVLVGGNRPDDLPLP